MANEKRLIWDEDAKRHLIALAVGHHTETLHIDMILNAILHHAPTVDAVEVVHGQWRYYSTTMQECSICHRHTARHKFKYCPHCGAIMEDRYNDG